MVDQKKLELVLDLTAVLGWLLFQALLLAGVLSWGNVALSIGLFTGWLLRHLLR